MIGSLRGVLLDHWPWREHGAEVLVEAGGVGYRAVVPSGALARLGEAGSAVFLHVHTHVREDAIVLFGFPTREERVCFEALIGAHGVGPAVAVAMLSVHSPAALRRAVATEDVDALTLVPGIGPKTAARLLVELKSRLGADEPALTVVGGTGATGPGIGAEATRHDVRVALAGLGYGADEIRQVLGRLPREGAVEDLVRLALKDLAASG
ncbi:MAG TPA: Holliday junction branch migration protein RuvA [Acidimicrobiales bacterium]|nr:Holliday junction branch migration protein RuvA [Acidimicrobiales bacterium]